MVPLGSVTMPSTGPTARQSPDVSLLVHSFAGGGAERVAVELANAFSASGLSVDVVVQRGVGPYLDELHASVRVLEIGQGVVTLPLRLWVYLRKTRPRAVLSFLLGFNLVSSFIRTTSVPRVLVLTEHNPIVVPKRRAAWKRFMLRLLPRIYRRADKVVAVSPGIADELVALGLPSEMVSSIPNPLNVRRIQAVMDTPVDHPFFEEGMPVLVAVGRLEPQKDYPTMLVAFGLLCERRNLRLLVLGEGRERPTLERMASELGVGHAVDFVGFQACPWAWVARADLFVLSSRFEGWGNVIAESLAVGTRVVSTDCPTGPAEILGHGAFGSLVQVSDPAALAAGIESELATFRDPAELRRRAEEWNVDRIADRYLALLRNPTRRDRN